MIVIDGWLLMVDDDSGLQYLVYARNHSHHIHTDRRPKATACAYYNTVRGDNPRSGLCDIVFCTWSLTIMFAVLDPFLNYQSKWRVMKRSDDVSFTSPQEGHVTFLFSFKILYTYIFASYSWFLWWHFLGGTTDEDSYPSSGSESRESSAGSVRSVGQRTSRPSPAAPQSPPPSSPKLLKTVRRRTTRRCALSPLVVDIPQAGV